MEWDTKLSERTTKEIIHTQFLEDEDSFIDICRIISKLKCH